MYDPAKLVRRHRDLAHDVVGGETERVVDVDDDRIGCRRIEAFVGTAEARIETGGVEFGEVDDLDADVEGALAVDVVDPALVLLLVPPPPFPLHLGPGEVVAGGEVEEIFPGGAAAPGFERFQLRQQLGVVGTPDGVGKLGFAATDGARRGR